MLRTRDSVTIDEALHTSVGEFGRGQQRLYFLLNYVGVLSMLQIYSMVFTELSPLSEESWMCTSPTNLMCQELYAQKQNLPSHELQERFCQMSTGEWMWTHKSISMVSDFDLQCSTWIVSIADGLFFVGVLIGASTFGYFADRLGRRPMMYLSIIVSGASCVLNAVAPSYWWYLVLRTITGIGSGGGGLISFVLVSEVIGSSKRGKLLIGVQLFAVIGSCIMAGLGYILPEWRKILLVIGTLTLLYLISWDATMESPRWLLIKGRKGEATAVLAAIASGNGTKLPEAPLHDMMMLPTVSRTFWQILKHPVLRKWLLVTLIAWMSVSLSYYGVSLALESIPGSLYTKFLSTVSIEFPAIMFYVLTVDRIGRKPLFAWGFLLGGAACALIAIVPSWLRLPLAVVAKFTAAGVFAVAYLYSSEIFPTVVRNATIGYASSSARLGGILAAFIPVTAHFFGAGFPFIIFGGVGIFAGFVCFLLPETFGHPTPETIEDMDTMISTRKRAFSFRFPHPFYAFNLVDNSTCAT